MPPLKYLSQTYPITSTWVITWISQSREIPNCAPRCFLYKRMHPCKCCAGWVNPCYLSGIFVRWSAGHQLVPFLHSGAKALSPTVTTSAGEAPRMTAWYLILLRRQNELRTEWVSWPPAGFTGYPKKKKKKKIKERDRHASHLLLYKEWSALKWIFFLTCFCANHLDAQCL